MRSERTTVPVTKRPPGRPRTKPIPPEGPSAYEQRVASDLAMQGSILLLELNAYLASPEPVSRRRPVLLPAKDRPKRRLRIPGT